MSSIKTAKTNYNKKMASIYQNSIDNYLKATNKLW